MVRACVCVCVFLCALWPWLLHPTRLFIIAAGRAPCSVLAVLQASEFVTPDYFQLGPDPSTFVFLTSTNGAFPNTSAPSAKSAAAAPAAPGRVVRRAPPGGLGRFSFANMFVGRQATPGGPFVADPRLDAAYDWSSFAPKAAAAGPESAPEPASTGVDALELAPAHGRSQLGCCPKTAGQGKVVPHLGGASIAERRVAFGWVQNGGSDSGEPDRDPSSTDPTVRDGRGRAAAIDLLRPGQRPPTSVFLCACPSACLKSGTSAS